MTCPTPIGDYDEWGCSQCKYEWDTCLMTCECEVAQLHTESGTCRLGYAGNSLSEHSGGNRRAVTLLCKLVRSR